MPLWPRVPATFFGLGSPAPKPLPKACLSRLPQLVQNLGMRVMATAKEEPLHDSCPARLVLASLFLCRSPLTLPSPTWQPRLPD